MKQSRFASWFETIGNTGSGFVLAMIAQAYFWPWLGFAITIEQNLIATTIMTVLSLARSYGWRRAMEALHVRHPISPFMAAVIAERRRQVEQECWSIEHDDKHKPGELAAAGAAYLYAGSLTSPVQRERLPRWYENHGGDVLGVIRALWPWDWEWWKPRVEDRRRDLVRGCALGIAEGEKFDRSRAPRTPDRSRSGHGPFANTSGEAASSPK